MNHSEESGERYWIQVGRDAFHNGQMRAPFLDAKVKGAVEERQPEVGDPWTMNMMNDFTRGWDLANLAQARHQAKRNYEKRDR